MTKACPHKQKFLPHFLCLSRQLRKMSTLIEALSLSHLLCFLITSLLLITPSSSATNSFIYGGCTQLKYNPGTVYESNVNSLLTSLVNSAASSGFNNFKISLPGSTQSDVVYGLFQCRGDLTNSDCHDCVVHAVSRIGTICVGTSGGVLQLEGCYVKYDNVSFLGVEDKTVVLKKCDPSMVYDSDSLTRRDAVLTYLAGGGQYFRVGGSGTVQGVAQCVQDLSLSECQDCLSESIGRLKTDCATAAWGDMFLGKCYVRYSERGHYSTSGSGSATVSGGDNNDNDDVGKTLAIIIGVVAGAVLIIVLVSALHKIREKKAGK